MSGVELILAAIGFPLAVATAVPLFQKAGKYLADKVQAYPHRSAVVDNFVIFGMGLSQGVYALDADLVRWVRSMPDNEMFLYPLEKRMEELKTEMIAADRMLEKYLDAQGNIKKGRFWRSAERDFARSESALQKWQDKFVTTINQIERHRRIAPLVNLLDSSRFAERAVPASVSIGEDCHAQPYGRVIMAEVRLDGKQPTLKPCLIESRSIMVSEEVEHARRTNSEIAQKLSLNRPGILPCIGYRETGELVFELPDISAVQQSLWSRLHDTNEMPSLNYRVSLARQVTGAVLSVHQSGLIHKNIRSQTIRFIRTASVSLSTSTDFNSTGTARESQFPVLTHWGQARLTRSPSRASSQQDWHKDVYRHPERQGVAQDTRYNIGHELYSLGACLIEIGLWQSLIVEKDGEYHLSAQVLDKAVELGCLRAEDRNNSGRLLEPGDVQLVLINLATIVLPSRMGRLYANAVVGCLRCVEDGLGDVTDLNDVELMTDKFGDIILGALNDIHV